MAWLQRASARYQSLRDRPGLRSAQAHDANAAASGRCRDSDDGVLRRKGHAARRSMRGAGLAYSPTPARGVYFLAEISTVFEKASPTLSVVAPGISATAMWTMRRSYGFSGPSC